MMPILAYVFSTASVLMSVLLLMRLKVVSPALFVKLAAGALSPYWAVLGAAGAALGWLYGAPAAVAMGLFGAGIMTWHVWRCTRPHTGFENAFGAGWSGRITPRQARQMVKRRWTWFLRMQASPAPAWERDIPFWTIPGTERQLLCDVWHPSDGRASGLALVYLHSSGWAAGDKDFGTRPFFRHLVAQGHTVMDVAYRLCPEVDIHGMVADVKRAIAWMKANAARYGVDPRKVVLGGGSAGAHLALLAGYTARHPQLTPQELAGADLSVCGILSYYGPSDLPAGYDPWRAANPMIHLPAVPIGTHVEPRHRMRYAGRMDMLLGGRPDEVPEAYRLASPPTHVGPGCPPTLLLQGDQDLLVSLETTRALHAKLVEAGVPAILVIFPWTDHVFDLVLPQVSPAAQSSLYDVDRFLALLLNREGEA
jgi:acetyl esterase/lipase